MSISRMKSLKFCCLLVLGLLHLINSAASPASGYGYTPCNGSIAECNEEEDEQLMESETSRRFLAEQKRISYGVLNPNQPVCNGGSRGQAYSKNGGCLPLPSNPPSRGCSKYYRCRTGS
ncbi:protein RALF-like 32 [Juglans microcarpa x Juglans regia]|uniref:protein RALF-like 32 n=1 Tax=Juglans microcarpa x Juglans regia TaxID=2249226 RepID=UPI001B7F6FE0|nr:protein RALF-like 32 [Juglans microcarpa x Juglans regia]